AHVHPHPAAAPVRMKDAVGYRFRDGHFDFIQLIQGEIQPAREHRGRGAGKAHVVAGGGKRHAHAVEKCTAVLRLHPQPAFGPEMHRSLHPVPPPFAAPGPRLRFRAPAAARRHALGRTLPPLSSAAIKSSRPPSSSSFRIRGRTPTATRRPPRAWSPFQRPYSAPSPELSMK